MDAGTAMNEGRETESAHVVQAARPDRLVYLMQTPLNARDADRYGMADMAAAGIDVSVVDATDLVNPALRETRATGAVSNIEQHLVRSAGDLKLLRPVLRQADFVICLMSFDGNPAVLQVYRALARSKTPYIVISANAFPGFTRYRGDSGQRMQRAKNIVLRLIEGQIRPLRSLLFRLPPEILGTTGPTFIVHGGRASYAGRRMFPADSSTRVIRAHAMDYDHYLRISANPPAPQQSAVFIDEHIGFQRDLQAIGARATATPDDFYPKLRRLFDRIEQSLGLEVVIAANPRANYADKPPLFGDRRIEYNATARLIAESQLVVGHRSTAIGYAVMFRRPVMLVATREMYDHWVQRPAMDAFSKALNTPVRMIDDTQAIDLTDALNFDVQSYDRYEEDYIKIPGTPKEPFWTIVRQEMRNYMAER